jgi:biotin synthase
MFLQLSTRSFGTVLRRAQLSTAAGATAATSSPPSTSTLHGVTGVVRTDWTREEVQAVYDTPLMELVYQASTVHRMFFHPLEVQQSTLLSIKTGGCTENCGYCSQSSHHKTFVKPEPTLPVEEIMAAATRAKEAGSTRFCMGSAWREVGNKRAFNKVLDCVRDINGMGMEVCTTLGMLTPEQARQLKEAGLTAYNHNLDTSPEYYPKVVQTRSYEDRLNTVANVREAGISVCCGGILGMGEEDDDRVGLIHTLATLEEHPESVPLNALVPVPGTPLGDLMIKRGETVTWDEMVRAIATARIVMPKSMVRLSAGRKEFPEAAQALMFSAGANSIFTGDTLLTTANPEFEADKAMFTRLGLKGKAPHAPHLTTPYASTISTHTPSDAGAENQVMQEAPEPVIVSINGPDGVTQTLRPSL